MRRPQLVPIASLLAAAVLCGCSDPYLREGTWHATGVNEDNLHAMLADPGDAAWGDAQTGTDGQLAAAAVTRLRTGTVKPLPTDAISKIGGGAAQTGGQTGGETGGQTGGQTAAPASGASN